MVRRISTEIKCRLIFCAFYDIVLYRTITFVYPLISSNNQNARIKATINSFLDQGLTDKQIIYNMVVDELGVPRPTVRRVARDLRNELLEKINILQSTMSKQVSTNPDEISVAAAIKED